MQCSMPPFLLKTLLSLERSDPPPPRSVQHPSKDALRIVSFESKGPVEPRSAQLQADLDALLLGGIQLMVQVVATRKRAEGAEEDAVRAEQAAEAVQAKLEAGQCQLIAHHTWVVAQKAGEGFLGHK